MRRLLCRLTGHDMVCGQEVLLYPVRGGLVFHQHRCNRCGDHQPFQTQQLDPDWEFVIRETAGEITIPTSILMDPLHPLIAKR